MSGHFWLKLKHGAPANPKWRMIAQKVGCPQGEVWTLYSWALDFAGQHQGSLKGFDLEEVAATTDYVLEELQRIWTAFVDKAIIVGEAIHNWTEHQGEAATARLAETAKTVGNQVRRAASTPRVRKHREQQREAERQLSLLLPIDGTRVSSPNGDDGAPVSPPEEEKRERSSEVDSSPPEALKEDEGKNDKGASEELCALSAADAARKAEKRKKRANLIKTLTRWVRHSGELDKDDQVHRLLMLNRAEAALDCWGERDTADKQCFDYLATAARRKPLAKEWVIACEETERAEARQRMAAGWGQPVGMNDLFFPSENHRQSLLGRVEAGGFAALNGQERLEYHGYRYGWKRRYLRDHAQKYQCDPRGEYFDGVLVGKAFEFYGGKLGPVQRRPDPTPEDIAHVERVCAQIRTNLTKFAERNRAAFKDTDLAAVQADLGLTATAAE